jgi:hypothetical protein
MQTYGKAREAGLQRGEAQDKVGERHLILEHE